MKAPAHGRAARRLETFKRLLGHLRELLALDFGFVLWDGSTVPADLAANKLGLVLADEGVVAALLRRPNADTFLNLWVTRRIDIRNGVIFDFLDDHLGMTITNLERYGFQAHHPESEVHDVEAWREHSCAHDAALA